MNKSILSLFLTSILITSSICLEDDPYDFSSSYFCSTCFTNNQDQNYHCCFYFFKCCAEARRGSKSTTPGLNYPVLPTHIAYIVQDKSILPCPETCKDNIALCCLSWNSQASKSSESTTTTNYFQAAQEFEGYVEADSMVKNSTDEVDESADAFANNWPTSENYPDTDKPFHLALGANINPSKIDSSYFGSTKKLFIPPSLASGHESYDSNSNKEGTNARTLGWITKDLLKFSEEEKK
ncbi:uncharacterized protein LOC129969538 isoform X1 [Argiope bruennichi]|uniref:Uncharacterized protein n=1 Tax=Argiope bruennichi TaxID=94029 RepID=A0A8T0FNP7_ARGBR|nr:uncharacterized protein LOC129969538 isoform X1 [Argiope bruennichi]KAF8792701.1 hypothetical protein HNY73_004270 [Argiope bruennichi]